MMRLKVSRSLLLLSTIFAWGSTLAADSSPSRVLTDLHRVVPSVAAAVPEDKPALQFSGQFAKSPEVARRAGLPTAGDTLYLFPDQTYLYLKWYDIAPDTIYDKGSWSWKGQFISLASDNSVPPKWQQLSDRTYLPVTAEVNGKRELFLIGLERQYPYFLQHSRAGDDFEFLLCFRARVARIDDFASAKAKLMKDCWKPETFRSSPR